jgi:hypothetical protein
MIERAAVFRRIKRSRKTMWKTEDEVFHEATLSDYMAVALSPGHG